MEAKKLIEILDKNINQEQLAKDLAVEFVLPFLKEKIAGIDLVPGTDLDKKIIMKALNALEAMVK